MLNFTVIGKLSLTIDGEAVDLPASRKTRALIAYLALEPREHSRQKLCELLWQVPDDPRAALRWSLSKLRSLINEPEREALTATRNTIVLDEAMVHSDFAVIANLANDTEADPQLLQSAWDDAHGNLLEDCELSNQPEFSQWLNHHRGQLERYKERIARSMAYHPELEPTRQDRWAQRWLALNPLERDAALRAVETKRLAGQAEAAEALEASLSADFLAAGLTPPDFVAKSGAAQFSPAEPKAFLSADPAENLTFDPDALPPEQSIQFVNSIDDVTIAWGAVGSPDNPPLVKAANWLTHMELDWQAPIWSPLYHELAKDFHFVRYDERGCGLSDWDVSDISLDGFVSDLEQVVDAAGLERFPLLGISQGAAVSIEYAARHPDRVSHLILFGGYDSGWRHTAGEEEVSEREAVMVLTKTGWGRTNPAYRHMFSKTFMPEATPAELEWFDEFQRQTVSPENAARFLEAFSQIDVRERLEQITCPALVIHSRGDQRIPFETGRRLAAKIPGAQFAGIESANHLLLGREAAAAKFVKLTRDFLLKPK
ncbi:MAG: alpha/beta fold hydrolase [Erythrobacter sp.]